MNEFSTDSSFTPVIEWPDVMLGVWLRSLWLGSALAIMGAVMLASGEAEFGIALALLIGGGAFARWSWLRTRALLDVLDPPVPAEPTAQASLVTPRAAPSLVRNRGVATAEAASPRMGAANARGTTACQS